jgi:signal transduction histidine kinase
LGFEKKIMSALPERQEALEPFEKLISWFHESSVELTREYRRLEERVGQLNNEIEKKNQELEKSLREREEARSYLLSVLESLKAGVLVIDPELVPALSNRWLGDQVGEVDRDWVTQLLGESLAGRLRAGDAELLPIECERTMIGPGGVLTPVHLTISNVISEKEGKGYVLVLQDISRAKRLETETARSRRLSALGAMAAEVAHQIRSPLGGMELYASLLKEREQKETRRLAGKILDAIHRLRTTISRLLSFVAEPSIVFETVSVPVLLAELRELSRPLLRRGLHTLHMELRAELPALWGDRGLLAQALFNIVANAVEAMPQGGPVKVRARLSPFCSVNGSIHRTLEVQIIDQGAGIAQENRERVFDPFFTTKVNGTGLGLALAHKIVNAHGGAIDVSSQPGRGSTFTVSLPATPVLEASLGTVFHEEANYHCG